jgi:hypothetical protein
VGSTVHWWDAWVHSPGAAGLSGLPHGRTLPYERWAGRHRGMIVLLWAHVVALPIVALAHGLDVAHALAEGGVVAAFALTASLGVGDRRLRTVTVSLGLLTASAVLVHITGGPIEAHFHFFVVVTILSLYEDWLPFLLAIAFVALHHALGAALAAERVDAHADDSGIKWALGHAGFIAALSLANPPSGASPSASGAGRARHWRAWRRPRSATARFSRGSRRA